MDNLLLKVPVYQVDGEEECLWKKLEFVVDLNEPIYQDSSHLFIDVILSSHVTDLSNVIFFCP